MKNDCTLEAPEKPPTRTGLPPGYFVGCEGNYRVMTQEQYNHMELVGLLRKILNQMYDLRGLTPARDMREPPAPGRNPGHPFNPNSP